MCHASDRLKLPEVNPQQPRVVKQNSLLTITQKYTSFLHHDEYNVIGIVNITFSHIRLFVRVSDNNNFRFTPIVLWPANNTHETVHRCKLTSVDSYSLGLPQIQS